jgi:predicted TIM-barrel fold metal-dependent hydrolase
VWPLALALSLLADPPRGHVPPCGVVDVHLHLDASSTHEAMSALARVGVAWGLNLSGGSPGEGLEESLAQARADGRVVVAVNVPWQLARRREDFPALAARLMREAHALGARALKIEKALGLAVRGPDGRLIAVDDPWLDPIWATAGALGLPVFIHVGDPRAFWAPATPDNPRWAELSVHPRWSLADRPVPSFDSLRDALLRVVARHRATRFVSVHFGNDAEDVAFVGAALDAHPNLWIDLAARLPELAYTPTATLRAVLLRHADRVLFGTDTGMGARLDEDAAIMLGSTGARPDTVRELAAYYERHYRWLTTRDVIPSPTPIQGQMPLEGLALPPEVVARITRENAEVLLGPPPGARCLDAPRPLRFALDTLASWH